MARLLYPLGIFLGQKRATKSAAESGASLALESEEFLVKGDVFHLPRLGSYSDCS